MLADRLAMSPPMSMSTPMSIRVQSVIDLNELLLSMFGMLSNLFGEHIALSTILAARIGAIRMEASAMQEAILHLTGNFHNAMPNGGNLLFETENIHFDSEEACRELGLAPGEYIRLSVSSAQADKSPTEVAHSIADPSNSSMPLQFAPIYALARQHGGIATIRSGPNDTTMSLYLAREPGRQALSGVGS
jgi:hypothetical protein